jgi:hypothetical protein
LPVWTALSELFLDTSFDAADHDRIAEALRSSPYDRAELEAILRLEVSPAFSVNLLSVAGEWVPWTQDEVLDIMTRFFERRAGNGLRARLRRRLSVKTVPDDWDAIASRLN